MAHGLKVLVPNEVDLFLSASVEMRCQTVTAKIV